MRDDFVWSSDTPETWENEFERKMASLIVIWEPFVILTMLSSLLKILRMQLAIEIPLILGLNFKKSICHCREWRGTSSECILDKLH